MFLYEPIFYPLAIIAMLMVGISKGGFGGGLGMVGVPLMTLVIDPITAAAIMLPVLCVMDLLGLWAYRGKWVGRHLILLIPAAMLGILFGTLTFHMMDVDVLRLLIGLLALGFVAEHYARPIYRKGLEDGPPPGRISGVVWGACSGFTSFVAHAGGPPLSVYLLPQKMDKTLFVGTTVIFFTAVNYVKLVPYAWLGQFPTETLMTSLLLLPMAPVGIWLGVFLHKRISQGVFYAVCYLFLAITGVKLVHDGIRGLLG